MAAASGASALRIETWGFWLDGAPATGTASLTLDAPLEPLVSCNDGTVVDGGGLACRRDGASPCNPHRIDALCSAIKLLGNSGAFLLVECAVGCVVDLLST
jgi:hypothetical protein